MNNNVHFIESQEESWGLLKENRDGLSQTLVRKIITDGMAIEVQFNPCRVASNTAKTDKTSIAARKCFLCSDNRPEEQAIRHDIDDYETLANPFPIFFEHLTIAHVKHIHQDLINLKDMSMFLYKNPETLVFYNGSKSGASAPDHLHFQSCGLHEMSLPQILETRFGSNLFPYNAPHIVNDMPMKFWIADMADDALSNEWEQLNHLTGYDPETMIPDKGFRNILMYRRDNHTRCIVIPRKKHRPACYYSEDESKHISVSPGAVDMAGKIIVPFRKDFDKITATDITRIYDETGLTATEINNLHSQLIR